MQGLKASESAETVPSDNDSTPKGQEGKKTPRSKKGAKSSKKDRLNPARFQGEGVSFKAKLIGVEELNEARGDKLCQDTITRLKAAVKSTGTHKQRIWFSISLEGIKIREDKSGLEPLYHHAVPQISFISQDMTDDRAFGYICSPIPNTYHFVAIKTEKAASQVVLTLRDLFQTVLDMKQKQNKVEEAEAQEETMPDGSLEESSESAIEANGTSTEPIYSVVDALENKEVDLDAALEPTSNKNVLVDLLDLQFEPNVQQLEESIAQMTLSLVSSPFQSSPLLEPKREEAPSEPKPEEELPVAEPQEEPASALLTDRYAVFEDLDSVPSIFEKPIVLPPNPDSASPQHSADENGTDDSPALPPHPKDNSNKPFDFSILADLDPLGKDRPFVDKKYFFHDIKNPPKKVLSQLMGTSFDGATNGVSIRRLESQNSVDLPRLPPRVNPFASASLPPSTPPPILSMTSRCSDPMFPVSPSPPPHRPPRPMPCLDGLQSPPIPIPPRRASPLASEDSPITMRRTPRLSSGSDKSSPGNWGTFDDNFNDTPSPLALPKPNFVFPNKPSLSERLKNPFVNSDDVVTKANTFNPFMPKVERLTPPPTPPFPSDAAAPDVSGDVFTNSDVFSVLPPNRTTPTSSELISPEEGSIFRKKQDPFADDFFQGLEKK